VSAGWFRESYRHRLAANGVKTRQYLATRGSRLVDFEKYMGQWREKVVAPVPWYERGLRDVRAEYSLNPDGTVKVVNSGVRDDGELSSREGTAKLVSGNVLDVSFGPFMSGTYEVVDVDDDYTKAVVRGGDGTVWVLQRDAPAREATPAERKGVFGTDEGESAKEYIARNVKSSVVGDKTELFKNGVKKTLLHPAQDLDEEWEEYTEIKTGVPERLSDDPMGRAVQRGAALFGRVLTQANVEPMIDTRMDRSFRDMSMDVMFGRKES
jgi:lipocalin